MTAAVWIRGLLRTTYGVDLSGVHWFEGGVNERGVFGGASTTMRPAAELDIRHIGNERMLSDLLAEGEIDALIGAITPASFRASDRVARLFPNFHTVERQYFQDTAIHPIMHGLVLRKELHAEYPWLAGRIARACEEAKQLALRQTRFTGALRFMLPWLVEDLEEIEAVFGADPWPYGLAANRTTLDAFNDYLSDDGYLPVPQPLESIFVPVD
jgi:4,5-dihydroxyphthalate decarboxylase